MINKEHNTLALSYIKASFFAAEAECTFCWKIEDGESTVLHAKFYISTTLKTERYAEIKMKPGRRWMESKSVYLGNLANLEHSLVDETGIKST